MKSRPPGGASKEHLERIVELLLDSDSADL
jgi:hypothetical protein